MNTDMKDVIDAEEITLADTEAKFSLEDVDQLLEENVPVTDLLSPVDYYLMEAAEKKRERRRLRKLHIASIPGSGLKKVGA